MSAPSPPSSSGARRRGRVPRPPPVLTAAGDVTLENPRLLQKLERAAEVVEVAQVYLGALQVRKRGQLFVCLDAVYERVLVGVVGKVLLGLVGEREIEELPPGLGVLSRVEHPRARREHEGAGVPAVEEVVGGRQVLAPLLLDLEEVVVVDEGDLYLAGGDALDGAKVVRVDERVVCLDALEPLARPVLALEDAQRGDEGLEGAVGGGPADTALPLGVGEAEDGAG